MQHCQSNFYQAETYTLEESVGYLMRSAGQVLLKNIDTEMQALDLTGMQWAPVFLLAKGRCDTVASCARALFSDSGAMTRMLDRLEAKHLLCRVRSEIDRRVVNLTLTQAGSDIAQQIPARLAKVLNHHLQGFTEAEFALFKTLLRRFAENGNLPVSEL